MFNQIIVNIQGPKKLQLKCSSNAGFTGIDVMVNVASC